MADFDLRRASLPRRAFAWGLCASLATHAAWADPILGSPAPSVPVRDHEGHAVVPSPPADGVLVVDFFATWCGPCHEAIAVLDRLARDPARHVKLVIVDVGETPALVDPYFAAHPLPPGAVVLFDADGSAARAWGQHRFPTTFFVGSDGVIRHINRGYGLGYAARAQRWLDAMAAPPPR